MNRDRNPKRFLSSLRVKESESLQPENSFTNEAMRRWNSETAPETWRYVLANVMINGELRRITREHIPDESPALKWCRSNLRNQQIHAANKGGCYVWRIKQWPLLAGYCRG